MYWTPILCECGFKTLTFYKEMYEHTSDFATKKLLQFLKANFCLNVILNEPKISPRDKTYLAWCPFCPKWYRNEEKSKQWRQQRSLCFYSWYHIDTSLISFIKWNTRWMESRFDVLKELIWIFFYFFIELGNCWLDSYGLFCWHEVDLTNLPWMVSVLFVTLGKELLSLQIFVEYSRLKLPWHLVFLR